MTTIEEPSSQSDTCHDSVHKCFCGKKAAHATGSDQLHECGYGPCRAQWRRTPELVIVRPPRIGSGGVDRSYLDDFLAVIHG